MKIIRVQLVDTETGKVLRSFDVEERKDSLYTWLEITYLYDKMQKIMGGKATK